MRHEIIPNSNPVKNECVRFVNSYLDELVNLIVSEYTPEEICVAIREGPFVYRHLEKSCNFGWSRAISHLHIN